MLNQFVYRVFKHLDDLISAIALGNNIEIEGMRYPYAFDVPSGIDHGAKR